MAAIGDLNVKSRYQFLKTAAEKKHALDLIVMATGKDELLCRSPDISSSRIFLVSDFQAAVPGEIIKFRPSTLWVEDGVQYAMGDVSDNRFDLKALKMMPLTCRRSLKWNPKETFRSAATTPAWAEPIVKKGPRPCYLLEDCTPELDSETELCVKEMFLCNPHCRPQHEAFYCPRGAAMRGLAADLRNCSEYLDLGTLEFEVDLDRALRHYTIGVKFGEQALIALGFKDVYAFNGVLQWEHLSNRGFLRCLNGLALCLWRKGRFAEAEKIFVQLLWMNPEDNFKIGGQLLKELKQRVPWETASRSSDPHGFREIY